MRETLSALLERVAEESGDAPALIYGEETWSYADLLDRSRRAAAALAELGIGRGDKVALWLPNAPAWLALYFALGRLGAVAVAVNTRFRALEVADILSRSGAKALAMWPGFKDIDFAGLLAEIGEDALAGLERVLVYDEGEAPVPERVAGRPVTAVRALFDAPPLADDRAAPDDPCNIFTTSGTTSKPKFVLHGQGPVTRHARDCVAAFGWDRPGAVSYQATPLCGVFGFSTMMATLAAGAPNVLAPLFTPGEAAEAVRRHKVTHFMGTDDMYAGMLAAREEPEPFPSLRLCGYALFNPTLEDFEARTLARGVPLIGLYGMSEVGALMAVQKIDAPLEDRLAGGGYPVAPEAVVRVRNVETGALCPPGVSGEVEMRCPSLFLCYEGNPEATAAAMTEDGFLRTGDAGRMRADGSFVYEARMGDTLRLARVPHQPERDRGAYRNAPLCRRLPGRRRRHAARAPRLRLRAPGRRPLRRNGAPRLVPGDHGQLQGTRPRRRHRRLPRHPQRQRRQDPESRTPPHGGGHGSGCGFRAKCFSG